MLRGNINTFWFPTTFLIQLPDYYKTLAGSNSNVVFIMQTAGNSGNGTFLMSKKEPLLPAISLYKIQSSS